MGAKDQGFADGIQPTQPPLVQVHVSAEASRGAEPSQHRGRKLIPPLPSKIPTGLHCVIRTISTGLYHIGLTTGESWSSPRRLPGEGGLEIDDDVWPGRVSTGEAARSEG